MSSAPAKPRIEIDPSKLTMKDWATLEDVRANKLPVRDIIAIVVRASDWTEERLMELPSSAFMDILSAIQGALTDELNQKN